MAVILDLADDVILVWILPQLSAKDTLSLGSACRRLSNLTHVAAVWRQLVGGTYHIPPETIEYLSQIASSRRSDFWLQVYKRIAKSLSIYSWGQVKSIYAKFQRHEQCRGFFSHLSEEQPNTIPLPVFSTFPYPFIVREKLKTIMVGGHCYLFLTEKGHLVSSGRFHIDPINGNPYTDLGVFNPFPISFAHAAVGRTYGIAADQWDRLYLWNAFFIDKPKMILFERPARTQIAKLVAGYDITAILLESNDGDSISKCGGIVYLANLHQRHGGAGHGEARPEDGALMTVEPVETVMGTDDSLDPPIDVGVGEGFIVYITLRGRVYIARVGRADPGQRMPVELTNYSSKYVIGTAKKENPDGSTDYPRPYRIVSNYRRFAVLFTGGKHTLFGDVNVEPNSIPKYFSELDDVGCTDVGLGDHHCLALLANGDVMVWGHESRMCGSFGLGPRGRVEQLGGRVAFPDLALDRPTRVDLGHGKFALSVGAGGWRSCATAIDISNMA